MWKHTGHITPEPSSDSTWTLITMSLSMAQLIEHLPTILEVIGLNSVIKIFFFSLTIINGCLLHLFLCSANLIFIVTTHIYYLTYPTVLVNFL